MYPKWPTDTQVPRQRYLQEKYESIDMFFRILKSGDGISMNDPNEAYPYFAIVGNDGIHLQMIGHHTFDLSKTVDKWETTINSYDELMRMIKFDRMTFWPQSTNGIISAWRECKGF